jgi:hypothetical protein
VSTQQRRLRLYLNTSIIIRALEDPGAKEFLVECCRQHRCVVSSVHWLEDWKDDTLARARVLLEELGAEEHGVDAGRIGRRALAVIRARGWSESRLLDMMHVLAALLLDCDGIIAVDRFMARRAREYGLLYVNHYTGCP